MLLRDAEIYPNKAAVAVVGGPTVTYTQLLDRVRRLASGLTARGVRRGDRVLLMADNGLVYFDVYLAVSWIGAAAVPVNTRLAPREVDYIVENSEPSLAIASSAYVATVQGAMGDRVVIDADGPAYADLLAHDPSVSQTGEDDDAAILIYTSGTTGRPKGVCLTQAALAFNAVVSAVGQNFVPDDAFLSLTPLYHAATGTRVFTMIVDGQTHVVLSHFDEKACFDAIRDHRVTSTLVVPVQLRRLLESPDFASADLSSLRLLIYGAAPTDAGLIEKAREMFPCGLHQGYGLSEAVTNLTALSPGDHLLAESRPDLLASCGRITPGVTIELRDEDGAPVPDGEVGEIYVRTDKVMAGYWRNDQATTEAIVDGWLRPGDLARRDGDGYFFIMGRAKDMLISGGVNIYPMEIEAVLYEYPGISDVAVIGAPDPEWGEVPVAYLTLHEGVELDSDDIRAFCSERLSRIKVPRLFLAIDEFPRTENGKIRKRDLRTRDDHVLIT
jgi:acyl-CoA synthetase (AMP-forming)/AMP-acid ligase II